eukprot:gene15226-biopygen17169
MPLTQGEKHSEPNRGDARRGPTALSDNAEEQERVAHELVVKVGVLQRGAGACSLFHAKKSSGRLARVRAHPGARDSFLQIHGYDPAVTMAVVQLCCGCGARFRRLGAIPPSFAAPEKRWKASALYYPLRALARHLCRLSSRLVYPSYGNFVICTAGRLK